MQDRSENLDKVMKWKREEEKEMLNRVILDVQQGCQYAFAEVAHAP